MSALPYRFRPPVTGRILKRRWCRRNDHPISLAVTVWDGSHIEICYCARTLGMARRRIDGQPGCESL